MDNIIPVVFLLLAMTKTTISHRYYPASRMPDYDLDFDTKDPRTRPDYSISHNDDDADYKYDDEGDGSKPVKEFYGDDTNNDNRPKDIKEDIDTDLYHEDRDEEEDNRKIKYGRNFHIQDDYPLKRDDYKESDEKEASRYSGREFVTKKARRKPRDRPIKIILPENEHIQSNNDKKVKQKMKKDTLQGRSNKKILIEAFDDMKEVNNFKENLPLIIRQPVNMTEFEGSEVLPHRQADKIDNIPVTLKVPNATLNVPYNMTLEMEVANQSNLSLAERSRLSILKKILKKENSNVTKTTKPPVLIQVTNNMQTVVLVESNNLENEIKKVRRVMDDNPEVIERAKHLMRQKLVANAKSIEDLTDNWNEMVCDYIDLDLLNSASSRTNVCPILCCLKLYVFVMFLL